MDIEHEKTIYVKGQVLEQETEEAPFPRSTILPRILILIGIWKWPLFHFANFISAAYPKVFF